MALSATEAEYMSVSAASREAVWLRALLFDLCQGARGATIIRCDNRGAVSLTENAIKHKVNKHIDVRHHYVRDLVRRSQIAVMWVTSQNMVADVLTKPLPRNRFERWKQTLLGYRMPNA